MRESGKDLAYLKDQLGLDTGDFEGFLRGDIEVDDALASRLAEVVGASTRFWRERDAQYREDRRLVEADVWSSTLPVNYLRDYGRIPDERDWVATATACLEFFDVDSVGEWSTSYGPILATTQMRTTQPDAVDATAVATWLRLAVQSSAVDRPWDRDRFAASVVDARGLTKDPDPESFIPRLKSLCAAAGVRLSVVKAPPRCPVSGAAFLDDRGVRNIVLSARYLSDDHFWYTFFHEAGHILLHDAADVFLDELDESDDLTVNEDRELEADNFATSTIAPQLDPDAFRDGDFRRIALESSRLGISAGVLLGQLQHLGRIRFERMNKLKRRYSWNGPSLESRSR